MYGDSKELNEIGEINPLVYSSNIFKVYGNLTIDNDLHIIKVMMFNKLDDNGYMKIARISMEKPEYIDCEYKSYIFTKEELQEFIDFLSSKRDKQVPVNLSIPDYSKLDTCD